MMPTIIWTTWFIPMFVKALINSYQHEKGIKIHEGWQNWAQVIAIIAAAILHGIFLADVHTPKDWVPDDYTMAVLMFYPFSWLAFFDPMYNTMIGKGLLFYGTTAWIDRKVFQKIGKVGYAMVKLCALILTVVCIIIIYQEYV